MRFPTAVEAGEPYVSGTRDMHASQVPYPPHDFEQSGPTGQASPPRMSSVVKWLVVCGLVFGLLTFGLFATCIYVALTSPDTKVLPGRQVPARFVSQIRKLDLLEAGEQIKYFYSDGLLNIEEGFYMLTNRKVVIYSRSYDKLAILVPFADIADLDADFSDSWVVDSVIFLRLTDGTDVSFPVSVEAGGDRKMYEALKKACAQEP